jgi:hypothetical protein
MSAKLFSFPPQPGARKRTAGDERIARLLVPLIRADDPKIIVLGQRAAIRRLLPMRRAAYWHAIGGDDGGCAA